MGIGLLFIYLTCKIEKELFANGWIKNIQRDLQTDGLKLFNGIVKILKRKKIFLVGFIVDLQLTKCLTF